MPLKAMVKSGDQLIPVHSYLSQQYAQEREFLASTDGTGQENLDGSDHHLLGGKQLDNLNCES